MLVQQAIFTSAQTGRSDGYQLVAAGPEITSADRRELSVWGPSHDSLMERLPEPASINFFPLPSGAFCVSRTVAAGAEYSARGGARIYTHCLIVPPPVLRRFANNPFALLRAAVAGGRLNVDELRQSDVDSFPLVGRAAVLDGELFAELAIDPGPAVMATFMEAALASEELAIANPDGAARLIAGVVNFLPVCWRPQFSFCTGLKHSLRRPFRVSAVQRDPAEQRRRTSHSDVLIYDPASRESRLAAELSGWPGFIKAALQSGSTSIITSTFRSLDSLESLAELNQLGNKLTELVLGGSAEESAFVSRNDPAVAADNVDINESSTRASSSLNLRVDTLVTP